MPRNSSRKAAERAKGRTEGTTERPSGHHRGPVASRCRVAGHRVGHGYRPGRLARAQGATRRTRHRRTRLTDRLDPPAGWGDDLPDRLWPDRLWIVGADRVVLRQQWRLVESGLRYADVRVARQSSPGMIRRMNSSNIGTVKAVSPWLGPSESRSCPASLRRTLMAIASRWGADRSGRAADPGADHDDALAGSADLRPLQRDERSAADLVTAGQLGRRRTSPRRVRIANRVHCSGVYADLSNLTRNR